MPVCLAKERLKNSTVWKPQITATSLTERADSAIRPLAASIRTCSTYLPGVIPSSCLNGRAKLRGLMFGAFRELRHA
jgi:hypothetical protein